MTDKTIGQQIDDKLAELVTRDDLKAALSEHTKAIIAAVNAGIEALRVDLNKAGVPVSTATRNDLKSRH